MIFTRLEIAWIDNLSVDTARKILYEILGSEACAGKGFLLTTFTFASKDTRALYKKLKAMFELPEMKTIKATTTFKQEAPSHKRFVESIGEDMNGEFSGEHSAIRLHSVTLPTVDLLMLKNTNGSLR